MRAFYRRVVSILSKGQHVLNIWILDPTKHRSCSEKHVVPNDLPIIKSVLEITSNHLHYCMTYNKICIQWHHILQQQWSQAILSQQWTSWQSGLISPTVETSIRGFCYKTKASPRAPVCSKSNTVPPRKCFPTFLSLQLNFIV